MRFSAERMRRYPEFQLEICRSFAVTGPHPPSTNREIRFDLSKLLNPVPTKADVWFEKREVGIRKGLLAENIEPLGRHVYTMR